MIDFRYHLVSLIAVFLALALGIVLGAGPLNEPLGDQLTGQVEELREDRDRLRTELEVSEAEVEQRDQFIDELAAATLGSRLEGRAVATVVLPSANSDDVADVRLRLEQAGATVTGQVQVTEEWTNPDSAAFRSSLAGQILGYLDPVPADGAEPGVILGTALGQALTRSDAEGAPTADARTLLELLADAGLVEVVDDPTQAANATVVIAPRSEETGPEESMEPADLETREQRLAEEVELVRGLAETGEGSVVAGSAATALDLVSAIRADSTAVETVTTTDSVSEITGRLNVPMALAVAISGEVGQFGVGADATAAVPPAVYLSPPASPQPEETADGAEGSTEDTGGDAGTTEDETADAA
ncbi:copper transporter [Georgenia wutianyii]|uniref:Copper transporter n=1 Tax=Georgenia wutianyii TaxID=2585135 RepID=A0ABX5VMN9_9MICO|nr:copper transporter [Georgenia wutianyii]QDB79762.1 copper transporter [Georgenia wutianyii]